MSPLDYLNKVEESNSQQSSSEEEISQEEEKPKSAKEKLSNQTHRSRSDGEARLFAKPFEKTMLAHSNNVLMDNAHRVILDLELSEPNLHQEGQLAAMMVSRIKYRLGLNPKSIGADKAYGAGVTLSALVETGIEPHVSKIAFKNWRGVGLFSKERFQYDEARDEMICPAGKRMPKRNEHNSKRQTEYRASSRDCSVCTLKEQCTRAQFRVANRHWDQKALDIAASLRTSAGYRLSQRNRKRIEHLFAEAKELMGLRRARRRGRVNVTEQCLMTALVQNIKRIVNAVGQPRNPSSNPIFGCMELPFAKICALLRRFRYLFQLNNSRLLHIT